MVTRVFGKVDGIDVDFIKKSDGIYYAEFPRKLDSGKYIIEVYAEDDAGNVSYCNTIVCTIDAYGACIHVESYSKYRLALVEDNRGLCYVQNIHTFQLVDQHIQIIPENAYVYLESIPPSKCRGGG